MILLFRCILNDEVRTAVEDRYRRYKDKKRMGKWPSMLTNSTTANRDRLSFASGSDDGKDIKNNKLNNIPQLSQAISQTSVSSETTASTDTGTPQHKAVLRTFSGKNTAQKIYLIPLTAINLYLGTEFSECSSEDRSSICSSVMEMPVKRDDVDISPNATRVSRRVSFLTVKDVAITSTEVLASRRRFSDLPTND